MIEVGKEEGLSLTFSPNTSFWGNDSKIYFSYPSDKVTVYCYKANGGAKVTCSSNGSSGTPILKKEIGIFVVVAKNPSTNWDDISITVTGIPVSDASGNNGEYPACESAPLKLTAYRIKIEVQEKPWGGSWIPLGAGAANPSIPRNPWYHLWIVNENAIRANVEPQCLADVVAETTFGALSVDAFDSPSTPPADAQPPWKKITASVNSYTVTATIITGYDDQLIGAMTPVDIVINDIASVMWQPVDNDVGGNKIKLSSNPTANGGGQRCFPEKDSPNAPTANNQINVKVTLSQQIPTGMNAKVYIDWFDPNNHHGSTIKPSHYNKGKRDNHGSITLVPTTLEFTVGQSAKTSLCTINSAYAGDNYIVAVHPNLGTVNLYQFAPGGKILQRPNNSGGWVNLISTMKTETLTVWRTLWIELDRMEAPTIVAGAKPTPPDPNVFYEVDRAVYGTDPNDPNNPNYVISGNWDIVEPVPADEPEDFDLAVQPPEIGLGILESELEKACIEVQYVPFSKWEITQVHPPFQRNVYRPTPSVNAADNNASNLWILYALSAYEGDGSLDHDPDFPNEHGHYGDSETFVRIFCETIRDRRHTEMKNSTSPQEYNVILQRTLAHEILHCFLGRHDLSKPYTSQDIMESGAEILATPAQYVLNDVQIPHVQANNNPKPL